MSDHLPSESEKSKPSAPKRILLQLANRSVATADGEHLACPRRSHHIAL